MENYYNHLLHSINISVQNDLQAYQFILSFDSCSVLVFFSLNDQRFLKIDSSSFLFIISSFNQEREEEIKHAEDAILIDGLVASPVHGKSLQSRKVDVKKVDHSWKQKHKNIIFRQDFFCLLIWD